MRFYRYWEKARAVAGGPDGKSYAVTAWGWSASGAEDARVQALARAQAAAQRLASGAAPGRYGYLERPLREEELDRIEDPSGQALVVITRNAYGARVMNAAQAMFVDVDLPAAGAFETLIWRIIRLWSRDAPSPQARREAEALGLLERQRQRDPAFGARVYRTRAGLRYLITHRTADPVAQDTLTFMEELRADPLYVRLTRAQACFRARLTPKPWRIAVPEPRQQWPWRDAEAERAFREWEGKYRAAGLGRAVCAFVHTVGNPGVDPAIVPVVERHDHETGAHTKLPLA
jgi:hypothetical protein